MSLAPFFAFTVRPSSSLLLSNPEVTSFYCNVAAVPSSIHSQPYNTTFMYMFFYPPKI